MITSRRICLGILLIALAVGSSGCFDSRSGSSPITTVPTKDKARLKVAIDWEQFASHTTKGLGTNEMTPIGITHVGARLEYPSESAVFMQSVKREVAESIGVITMEVSPAERADLYLVAVMQGDGTWQGNRARYLGVVRGLALPERTTIEIKMDDIDWIEASWHVSAEDEAIWNATRQYEASALDEYLDRPVIYVRDPFQVGRDDIEYDASFLGINGCSWIRGNIEGWREFAIGAKNSLLGNDHFMDDYSFQPCIDGRKFNLPSEGGRYLIEPIDNAYSVHWKL